MRTRWAWQWSITAFVEPREQRDAGVERRLEIELAAHRPLGHRRDLGLEAGIIGELVDAFDA